MTVHALYAAAQASYADGLVKEGEQLELEADLLSVREELKTDHATATYLGWPRRNVARWLREGVPMKDTDVGMHDSVREIHAAIREAARCVRECPESIPERFRAQRPRRR